MRTDWGPEITNEKDIKLTDPDGLFVVCLPCSAVTEQVTKVLSRHSYRRGRWIDHCATKYHQGNCQRHEHALQEAIQLDQPKKPILNQTSILLHYAKKRKPSQAEGLSEFYPRPPPSLQIVPSCEGIIPSPTKGKVGEQLAYFKRYTIPPTHRDSIYLLKKLPGGSEHPQLFASSCTNAARQRYAKRSAGLRCNECEMVRQVHGKAIRKRLRTKFERFREVEDILSVAQVVQSQIVRLTAFTRTPTVQLNAIGKHLKERALNHMMYYTKAQEISCKIKQSPDEQHDSVKLPDLFL